MSVKDLRLSYRGFDRFDLTVGHHKQPYSLAIEMSSNDIPFVEHSIDSFLILPFVDRAVGMHLDASGEHWFAAAGVYGETFVQSGVGDEGWGTSSRFVYAPNIDEDRVVHLGLRAAHRQPSSDALVETRDETMAFSDLSTLGTGPLGSVADTTLLGPELAIPVGRFSLFSGYTQMSVNRDTARNFDGWHVAAAWTLGGASRAASYAINAGGFRRLAPVPGRRSGTWEPTTRLASIDPNDGDIAGGSEQVLGVGPNWHVNPNVRFLFDLSRVVDTDDSSSLRAEVEGLNFLTLHAQCTF